MTPTLDWLRERSTVDENGCWVWQLGKSLNYAHNSHLVDGERAGHRIAWLIANGRPIPRGYHVHHDCRNRACVNPDHLRALTPLEHADATMAELGIKRAEARVCKSCGGEAFGKNLRCWGCYTEQRWGTRYPRRRAA